MLTIIGERLNATKKSVRQAILDRDEAFLMKEAKAQVQAGAHFLDANAGTGSGREAQDMEWLVNTIQKATDAPLCLDSPNTKVLEAGLNTINQPPIVNSISLETKRLDSMLELLQGRDCSVVALCMADEGLPREAGHILERARQLVRKLEKIGMPRENIFVDPLIQPIATNTRCGLMVLEAVASIKKELPGVRFVCGLSNISFGMPRRALINQCFLPMVVAAGLDSLICDPADKSTMAMAAAASMLTNQDPYCMDFIKRVQEL